MWKRLAVFVGVLGVVIGVGQLVMPRASANAQPTVDIAVPQDAPIPQQALRLRIIANSDSTADQTLKLEVRDAIVIASSKLLANVHSASEARKVISTDVPELRRIAQGIVQSHGYTYPVSAEVGEVAFPTKIYGNQVYPAGTYEALRLVIGAGQGQNWWCVLFPPLCFIDIADGDAIPNTGKFPDLPPLETLQVPIAGGGVKPVAVRLASVDYGEELWRSLQHWLHR